MPVVEEHAPGSFCWFELATTDQAMAKQFYGGLFGWSARDIPVGPDEVYTVFQIETRDVAAAYSMRRDQRAQGVLPNWLLYIRVDSADDSAEQALSAGGTIVAAPFDVLDLGRMAMLQDPTGAVFAVWQPRRKQGTGLAGSDGTVVWADLITPDQTRAGQFYRALFDWQMVEGKNMMPARPGQYFHIVNAADFIGGIPPMRQGDPALPAQWMIYFSVDDCHAALARARSLGGRAVYEPITMEGTRTFAGVGDPQGAVFAIADRRGQTRK